MQAHLGLLLVFVAAAVPAWSAPAGAEMGQPASLMLRDSGSDYSPGHRPSGLPTCGVGLNIGQKPGKDNVHCVVSTYKHAQSDGKADYTALMKNMNCKDYNKASTLVSPSMTNFDNSTVGKFTLSLSGNSCDAAGDDCYPLLNFKGVITEMTHSSACTMFQTNGDGTHGLNGYYWDCAMPCDHTPLAPKCGKPTKDPWVYVNGTSQRVSDISDCRHSAKACYITVSKAHAIANALTNTRDVTTTNEEGESVTVTAGADFLGTGTTVADTVSQSFSKAVANSVGVTKTTTITTTNLYEYEQKPGSTGYVEWIPLLRCQKVQLTCNKTRFHLRYCTQTMLADGVTPDGTYALRPTKL